MANRPNLNYDMICYSAFGQGNEDLAAFKLYTVSQKRVPP